MHIYQRHIAGLDQDRWLDLRIALDILFGDIKETILQFFQKPEWGIMKFSNFEKIRESNLVDYEYKYKRKYRRESTLLILCYR